MSDASHAKPLSPPLKQVTRFEASLLRILRFFFHQSPPEQALKLIREPQPRPICLSSNALHLIRDTLSKGCTLFLVRQGGWRRESFLRLGSPRFGRLWERSSIEDLTLHFSEHSLEFLLWLTAANPTETALKWNTPRSDLTVADELLFFIAYIALQPHEEIISPLRASGLYATHPLCWLAFPNDFGTCPVTEGKPFGRWVTEPGSLIIEALQGLLAHRWYQVEAAKGKIGDWTEMLQQGRNQFRILTAYLAAVDQANRPDLARFLLHVLARVLRDPDRPAAYWTGGLQGTGPGRLAERVEVFRSALSVVRMAEEFRRWQQRARSCGYLDEDYASSKFWLSEWDRFQGDTLIRRANRVIQLIEPLSTRSE